MMPRRRHRCDEMESTTELPRESDNGEANRTKKRINLDCGNQLSQMQRRSYQMLVRSQRKDWPTKIVDKATFAASRGEDIDISSANPFTRPFSMNDCVIVSVGSSASPPRRAESETTVAIYSQKTGPPKLWTRLQSTSSRWGRKQHLYYESRHWGSDERKGQCGQVKDMSQQGAGCKYRSPALNCASGCS